jgi:hypothetical protein
MSEWIEPLTGATPAWLTFVAQLDPVRLEAERFGRRRRRGRPLTLMQERPGSPEWRRMAEDHDIARAEYWARHRPPWDEPDPGRQISDEDLAELLDEVATYERRHERPLTDRHMEIAAAALRNQEGHAA